MVFMGSQKYPDENKFTKFIHDNGGNYNGETHGDKTIFYFNIQRNRFATALDIFAQFFIQPLIKKEAMKREREAVDNEFQRCLKSDFWRFHQVYATLAKLDHPMRKFDVGNKQTLSAVSTLSCLF